MTGFEWFALVSGLVVLAGITAIVVMGLRPPRVVSLVLLAAVGLALGVAIVRLAAISIPVFLALAVLSLAVRRIAHRRHS